MDLGAKMAYLKEVYELLAWMRHPNYHPTSVPLPELLIEKPVGESLAANTDTLQYTIAA